MLFERLIYATGRSLSSCPQDVGRIGVVTGRDDFNRSSLVASAHLGMGYLFSQADLLIFY
ncbi:hypothetical protein JOD43_002230 [Pullulanibacillus pueri]|nr:hypothetical protein [Pullulanibacillus pueri]